MYSPALFTGDNFNLWSPTRNKLSVDKTRHLFAPPLQAYSSDTPGASSQELEYTIQITNKLKSGLITPLVQKKTDNLRNIRNYGFNIIRPVGIYKTLEELDYEDQKNSIQPLVDASFQSRTDPDLENSRNSPDLQNSVDLDAQVENYDDSNHNSNIFSDDGFMADDVEYQVDHSLTRQIDSVGVESATATASATFTLNRSSATTHQTTIPSGASPVEASTFQDENDENNENRNNNENGARDEEFDENEENEENNNIIHSENYHENDQNLDNSEFYGEDGENVGNESSYHENDDMDMTMD